MISCGYTRTDLVEQLPDPPNSASLSDDVFATTKSEYWVRLADVSLYIFYKDIPHGSVTIEVKELRDNARDRVHCTSFFIETGEDLETLEWGSIGMIEKNYSRFDHDEDLFDLAEKSCLHHLIEDECVQHI